MNRVLQKQYIYYGLILIMIGFLFSSVMRIKSLETSIQEASAHLTGVYDLQPALYVFQDVKVNPTVENLDALRHELSFRKRAMEALIELHKNEITDAAWEEFEKTRFSEQTTDYLRRKPSEIDIAVIEQIEAAWLNHDYIKNDIYIQGLKNPSSFTGSYIDLIKALDNIPIDELKLYPTGE
ncbi:MAG: hypothetical protein SCK29_01300 [Bacillota bacterium]|nr:hypothetical protein [Bacillota bacterium]MDW7682736.1 hypothetical protein [Bacillota bacterium]